MSEDAKPPVVRPGDVEFVPDDLQHTSPRSKPWAASEAGEQIELLYKSGMSYRQIGTLLGFSHEWIRRQVKERGIPARGNAPTNRVFGVTDRMAWALVAGDAPEDTDVGNLSPEYAWACDVFAMPVIRGALERIGCVDTTSEGTRWRKDDAPRDFTVPSGLIPAMKLRSHSLWAITPREIERALTAFDDVVGSDEGVVIEALRSAAADGRWRVSDEQQANYLRSVVSLVHFWRWCLHRQTFALVV